ncbi:MAG: hypothetical protein ACW981_16985 [Candidatus Hodarchaeales archaeon]
MTTVEKNDEYEIVNASVFELIVYGGIIGGIAGGLAFSLLILILTPSSGFYSTVAGLFLTDNTDVLTGFFVHIGIAVIFGTMFGLGLIMFPKLGSSQLITFVSGIVWALILWIVAAHILMPFIMSGYQNLGGTDLLALDTWTSEGSIRSLLNHLIYGVLLAVVTWNLPSLIDKLRNK